jgi:methylmalonyl-CoA mutase cobalamin-binding domain/chain
VVGGIIPSADAERLKELGVRDVFGAGSSMPDIVDMIANLAA